MGTEGQKGQKGRKGSPGEMGTEGQKGQKGEKGKPGTCDVQVVITCPFCHRTTTNTIKLCYEHVNVDTMNFSHVFVNYLFLVMRITF